MGFLSRELGKSVNRAFREAQKKKAAEQKATAKKQVEAAKQANKLIEQAENCFSTVRKAVELVNTTTKPEVFFPQYALILENFKALIEMEERGTVDVSKYKPRENFEAVSNKFTDATNAFIDRFFEELQKKTAALQNEKAKADFTKRYLASLERYTIKMEVDSINYYYALKEQHK